MKLVWLAIAIVCLVAAALALWREQLNAAFVIATIGAMAWFLRYRGELKQSLTESRSPAADESETDSADENY